MGDWSDRPADAMFDLHGMTVLEAASRAEQFLRVQARVRLITGRGRGGGGAPIRTLLKSHRENGRLVADYALEPSEGSFLVRLQ